MICSHLFSVEPRAKLEKSIKPLHPRPSEVERDLDQVIDRDPSPSHRARFGFSCQNHLNGPDSLICIREVEPVAKKPRDSPIVVDPPPVGTQVSGISSSPLSRGLQSADVSRSPLHGKRADDRGFQWRRSCFRVFPID